MAQHSFLVALVTYQCCHLSRCRVSPATAVRDMETLREFLNEYDANVKDPSGQTVLHWAASASRLEEMSYALSEGATLELVDGDGRTAIHHAALNGHAEAVAALMKHGANAGVADAAGATPLYRAAVGGHLDAVKEFVRALPREMLNLKFPRTGGTPLHIAAYFGHIGIIETLIEYGASPCVRNKEGHLAIQRYIEEDHDEIAKELEEEEVVDLETRRRVVELLKPYTQKKCKREL